MDVLLCSSSTICLTNYTLRERLDMMGFLALVAMIWAVYYFFHYLGSDNGKQDAESVKHEKIWHLFNDDNDPY